MTVEQMKEQYRKEMEALGYSGRKMTLEEIQAGLVSGRECGNCTLCCKLLEVKPIKKPGGQWCKHCTPGKGCGIYAERPDICKSWYCGWRMHKWLGPEWYPLKSKMIVSGVGINLDPTASKLEVYVDPGYPNQWRKPEYLGVLRRLSRVGLEGQCKYRVVVYVGGKQWVVLPNKEVEYTDNGVIVNIGENDDGPVWDMVRFKNEEGAIRYAEFMNTFTQVTGEFRRATGLQGNVIGYADMIAAETMKRMGITIEDVMRGKEGRR